MGAHVSVPMYQRSIDQRYRLVAKKCTSCGRITFPPKGACPGCGRELFEDAPLPGTGRVYSCTTISPSGAPPEFFDQATLCGGYTVVLVALDGGPMIIGQIAGAGPCGVTIGTQVRAGFRRLYQEEGIIRYGYKFCPVMPG